MCGVRPRKAGLSAAVERHLFNDMSSPCRMLSSWSGGRSQKIVNPEAPIR
jgi:hypothetical protein